ncbi:MAG: dipeptidase [Polyangiaceae bacterium]
MRRALLFFALCPLLVSCASSPPPAATNPAPTTATAPPAPSSAPVVATVAPASAAPPATLEERVAKLQREAIIVDTHNDITSAILDEGFDLAKPDGHAGTDLAKLRAGGLSAEFFSIYVDERYYDHPSSRSGGAARRALDMIDITYQQIERHPRELVLATSVEDIRRAKAEGKVAVLMGIEGGHAIENSLYALREFYRLGVRYMTLTHSESNDWADSAGVAGPPPKPRHHGLSPFGEEVVREMQRIGMLVDISHVSDETFASVMRVAKAPVIASHSSARALCDVARNLSDDELRAVAKNGGVVMVNFFSVFLDPKVSAAFGAFHKKHAKEIEAIEAKHMKPADERAAMSALGADAMPKTPLSVLIDHIEHIAKVAGVDHVGLGSDWDGAPLYPDGIEGVDGLPRITMELVKRGWSDDDVKKVLGENFLRVFAEATAFAQATKTTLSGDGSTKALD